MKTVRHWKNSFQCDHRSVRVRGALADALVCHGLPTTSLHLMVALMEKNGYMEYVVPSKSVSIFRVVRGRH